jgi:hypothetical protein
MSRLFDAGTTEAKRPTGAQAGARDRGVVARERAELADKAMRAQGITTADEFTALAGGAASVQPIHYESFRRPGFRWTIEHAQVGPDYVFQVFPIRPTVAQWPDVVVAMIAVMDGIFPRTLHIDYKHPDPTFKVTFYTIRVRGVVGMPGWEIACRERALNGLVGIDAWGH